MANSSIKNAFERMWEHVVAALKANNIAYDDTKTALGVESVQEAIEYLSENGGSGSGTCSGSKDFPIELLLENWVLDEGTNTYTQTVSVLGLEEDSNPIIVLGSTEDEALDAYNCLTSDVVVADNTITFTSKELPTVTFTVIAKGSGGSSSGGAVDEELVAKVDELETDMATVSGKVDANTASIATNTSAIAKLDSDKQNNLSYGTFIGNIDYVNSDGSNNHVRDNSIVWVTPDASGNLPGEYFVLETFTAANGIITQKATIYIHQGLPIMKQRIYCNETWSGWEQIATYSDLAHRVMEMYDNPTQISSDPNIYTSLENLYNAMPNSSILEYASWAPQDNMPNFGLPSGFYSNHSTIKIVKCLPEYGYCEIYAGNSNKKYIKMRIGLGWNEWIEVATTSELSTLTVGTFTPYTPTDGSFPQASMKDIMVVRNNVTKMCTVTGVITMSGKIDAGSQIKCGNINFIPLFYMHTMCAVFQNDGLNTMGTNGYNLVDVGIGGDGGIYLAVPFTKAAGTAPNYVPFHFSFYTHE